MPAESVAAIYDRLGFYRAELKKLDDQCESLLMEWIRTNGRLVIGNGVSYYLGTDKKTKCNDVPATVEAILTACGGDFTRFCDVLSSNAIKYGAAKETLSPKQFKKLFTETVGDVLKVKKADDKFQR